MVFDRIQCSKADSKVSEEMNNYSEKKLRPKFRQNQTLIITTKVQENNKITNTYKDTTNDLRHIYHITTNIRQQIHSIPLRHYCWTCTDNPSFREVLLDLKEVLRFERL